MGFGHDPPSHIDMIVPGGEISFDGARQVSSRPAFLLPVRALAKLFRRLILRWSPYPGKETGLAKKEPRRFPVLLPVCENRAFYYHSMLIN